MKSTMTTRQRHPILILFAVCAFFAGHLEGEPFRSNVTSLLSISVSRPEGEQALMGFQDAISIQMAEESLFVQAIEIEIRIPTVMQGYAGSLAWSLYRSVKPVPRLDKVAYDGESIMTQVLPSRISLILQIPVSERSLLRSGPYATVIPTIVRSRDFPLVFKLSSFVKGVTPEMEKAEFKVRVRPLFIDEGILKLSIGKTDGSSHVGTVEVLLDEKRLERWTDAVFLKKGSHSLQVRVEGFRDELRTFVIESGKVSELSIVLLDTKPSAIFEAPANAQILLDGAAIDFSRGERILLEPGEHTVVCKIGDYTITRKFTAFRGKSYRLVLSVELMVQEDP